MWKKIKALFTRKRRTRAPGYLMAIISTENDDISEADVQREFDEIGEADAGLYFALMAMLSSDPYGDFVNDIRRRKKGTLLDESLRDLVDPEKGKES